MRHPTNSPRSSLLSFHRLASPCILVLSSVADFKSRASANFATRAWKAVRTAVYQAEAIYPCGVELRWDAGHESWFIDLAVSFEADRIGPRLEVWRKRKLPRSGIRRSLVFLPVLDLLSQRFAVIVSAGVDGFDRVGKKDFVLAKFVGLGGGGILQRA